MMGPKVNDESTDPPAIRALDAMLPIATDAAPASILKLVDEIFAAAPTLAVAAAAAVELLMTDVLTFLTPSAMPPIRFEASWAALPTPSRPSVDCLKFIPDFRRSTLRRTPSTLELNLESSSSSEITLFSILLPIDSPPDHTVNFVEYGLHGRVNVVFTLDISALARTVPVL